MPLPKLETPTYTCKLYDGTELKFRPFLVKEQEVLLEYLEAEETKSKIDALIEIISACLLEHDREYVSNMSLADALYTFIQIRCKSVGEKTDAQTQCPLCETKQKVTIDFDKIGYTPPKEKPSNPVALSNEIFVELSPVRLKDALSDNVTDTRILARCIERVITKDETIDKKDFTEEEAHDWVSELTQPDANKISEFFINQPEVKHRLEVHCKQCNKDYHVDMSSVEDFFV